MNELHAVVALDQLVVLDDLVARRRATAERYASTCAAIGFDHQHPRAGAVHSWVHFVLRVPSGVRSVLAAALSELGVETKPYFLPLHRYGFGSPAPTRHPLPVTDRLGAEVLAVPMSSELSEEQGERVAAAVERAWGRVSRITPSVVEAVDAVAG